MILLKAEWANASFTRDHRHMALLRELASLHCLCEECFQLSQDGNGRLTELTQNSALHWSRAFEWPWALVEGEIAAGHRCLDVGGGHAVFQYVAARCCAAPYINLDSNVESLKAARVMARRLGLNDHETVVGKLPLPGAISNSFDRVFCISVVEHCQNWREVLLDCSRVLKPDGLLIVTMDVNAAGLANSKEFFIKTSDVLLMLDMPELPANALAASMPDGAQLNCLCLKFRKE